MEVPVVRRLTARASRPLTRSLASAAICHAKLATVGPAVIVFGRQPVSGKTKTRLIPALGARTAAELARAFNQDAAVKAARIGAPVVVAGTGGNRYFSGLAKLAQGRFIRQGTGDLGDRMARALSVCRTGGAILIGTDTPTLPDSCLLRAIELLSSFPVVLGPSLDGGYYLIGVRGTMPEIFKGINWGSSQVLAQTQERLGEQGIAYALAPWWYDVDEADDLWLLAAHLRRLRRQQDHEVRSNGRPLGQPRRHPCPATAALMKKLGLV